jgi:hypothetical protein
VRGVHREIRDEVDGSTRRADAPARRRRPQVPAGAAAREAIRRVCVAAGDRAAPARPAAAALGARARVPRALLH